MRSWVFAGGETVAGPILIAFVFMAGTSLLLYSGLALLDGKLRASLATIVLAGTPLFIRRSATQYADVPLAFFYLATLVLLCLADREKEGRHGLLALAGLACGMAAWTKNEGLLFMVCVLLARIWTLARTSGIRTCWSQMRPFLAGLLPVVLVILFFKIRYAVPNDILGPAGRASALERVLTPSRYATTGEWFLKQAFAFGQWDELRFIPISSVPLLLGALVLFGLKSDARGLQGPTTAAWTLGLTLAGYFFIFLITPNTLEWQLSRAGVRLLLQLWPSALFLFFMVIRDPFSGPEIQPVS
jgi:4-amino-4-deoxy-L-arabinose transferase-like glycosyltransferase